jgi:hypothetical protein
VTREPVPPDVPRTDVLGRLKRERWFAADADETARVAQIDAQIARLSAANTATPPTRETTAAAPAATENTARRPAARTNPRGDRRVRTGR